MGAPKRHTKPNQTNQTNNLPNKQTSKPKTIQSAKQINTFACCLHKGDELCCQTLKVSLKHMACRWRGFFCLALFCFPKLSATVSRVTSADVYFSPKLSVTYTVFTTDCSTSSLVLLYCGKIAAGMVCPTAGCSTVVRLLMGWSVLLLVVLLW